MCAVTPGVEEDVVRRKLCLCISVSQAADVAALPHISRVRLSQALSRNSWHSLQRYFLIQYK